jgi:polar amino acid transport system substrate-binding protein
MKIQSVLLLSVLSMLVGAPLMAQSPAEETIQIGVHISSPNVMKKASGAGYYGFDISIWQAIAEENGWESYEFVESESLPELIKKTSRRGVDISMGGISKTDEREGFIDFSHSYNSTGLGIMLNQDQSKKSTILSTFLDSAVLWAIFWFFVYIVASSHAFWLAENRANEQVSRNYFHGAWDQCTYWSVVTASSTGYGDITAVTRLGRLISVVSIFIGFIYFAAFLGIFGAEYGSQKAQYDISTALELRGKSVATAAGTTSEQELNRLGASVVALPSLQEAFTMLEEEKVSAVVFDEPNLLYYARTNTVGKVVVSGETFAAQVRKELAEASSEFGSGESALSRLGDLRKQVDEAETEAEALEDLTGSGDEDLADKYAGGSSAADDLAALKAELAG